MKYVGFTAAAILGVVILLGVFLGLGYVGFSNDTNRFENQVKAKYTDNQNVYDNGWKKVKEMAQVPDMQVAGLKAIYDGVMKGRYGANGSQALLQMIKEDNPKLDQQTYIKIQIAVEDFHNEFQANQTQLISVKQSYENYLTATTSGRFYNTFGKYPHIDLAKFDIVTSDKTQKDFDTKKADELKLK
jgi:hypothetical protein